MFYFETYRNIETVNILKKKEILKENIKTNFLIKNLMQSLTLLKLCNDPDFEKLSEMYKGLYIPWVGQEQSGPKALDELIDYLNKLK